MSPILLMFYPAVFLRNRNPAGLQSWQDCHMGLVESFNVIRVVLFMIFIMAVFKILWSAERPFKVEEICLNEKNAVEWYLREASPQTSCTGRAILPQQMERCTRLTR